MKTVPASTPHRPDVEALRALLAEAQRFAGLPRASANERIIAHLPALLAEIDRLRDAEARAEGLEKATRMLLIEVDAMWSEGGHRVPERRVKYVKGAQQRALAAIQGDQAQPKEPAR